MKTIRNSVKSILVTFKMIELLFFYCLFYCDKSIYVDHENATVYAKTNDMCKRKKVKRSLVAFSISVVFSAIIGFGTVVAKDIIIPLYILGVMFCGLIALSVNDFVKALKTEKA